MTEGDIWLSGLPSRNLPDPNGSGLGVFPFARVGFVDQDFGDAPTPYTLPDGTRVVGAGHYSS